MTAGQCPYCKQPVTSCKCYAKDNPIDPYKR